MTTLSPTVLRGSTTDDQAPSFTVRPARPADRPLVVEFVSSSADWYREFVDEADMNQHEVDEAWAKENFARRDFYIGEVGDEAVGTISLQQFGEWTYLGYVYLDVAHVGRGFGRMLLEFAERNARERDSKGLCLIAHPEAAWATRAYRKFGFECIAQTEDQVCTWNDGVLRPYYEGGFELYAKRLA